MQLESKKYFEDIRKAAQRILEFTDNKTIDDYDNDVLLSSGVERQFMIIGEAINKLNKVNPDIISKIANYRRVISFRNVLVHGYDAVDNDVVWDIIQIELPALLATVEILLN